jgi:hypothetical protein
MAGRLRLAVNPYRRGTDGTLLVGIPSAEDADGVAVVEATLELERAGAALWLDAVFTWSQWRGPAMQGG